ncbi:hypothetical protein EYR40_002432 [Pleurotus pulmonarius]|nr:hypothetical protein EYR40_002432 [Pleurotus pulmonarius]
MDVNGNVGMDMSGVFGPIYWGSAFRIVIPSRKHNAGAFRRMPALDLNHVHVRAVSSVPLKQPHHCAAHNCILLPNYMLVKRTPSLPVDFTEQSRQSPKLVEEVGWFQCRWLFVPSLHLFSESVSATFPHIRFSIISIAKTFSACTSVMFVYDHHVLGARHHNFSIFFGLAKGFGALTDIIATIAMCILLSGAKTGIQQTNGLLKSLIHYVVHRGVLVTLIQTLLLITFYAAPSRLYWLAFHVNVTKLYANTFFAMLNSRDQLKQKHAHTVSTSYATYSKGRYASNNATHDKDAETQTAEEEGKNFPMNGMPTVTKTVIISDF